MRNDFRELYDWVNTTQKEIIRKLSNLPQKLYRYQSYSDEMFLSAISGNVKISDPSTFNDLYDCFPLSDDNLYPYTQNAINLLLSNVLRIASFSTKNDSLLMWAHYASCNTGVCYCYDIPSDYNNANPFASLIPVLYMKNPPNITPLLYQTSDQKQEKVKIQALSFFSIIKPRVWEYEEEVRLCVQKNPITERKINKTYNAEIYPFIVPTGVILGARFPTSKINYIKKKFNGEIYKINPSTSKYEYKLQLI